MATNCTEPSFTTLAEEFLRRRRTGGMCSVEQFAEEYPQMRDVIQDEFPALILAESLKEKECTVTLPHTLGRYKVGQEIGRGAMGIVVSGTNPDLESEVAIKLLPFERIRSIEMLQRFHAEAKLCASIDHPNIVPVFDYGTDDNFAYLVMRKVPGNSLDVVIAELAKHLVASDTGGIDLDWSFITSIGIQASDALHYAHDQGVIHRDIKPANLILEEEGRLWVTDFGLSKVLSSDLHLSMTGDVVGTPRYMAPEQLRGVYDVRSDIYSLGMTLYELLAVKPFWDPAMSTTELLAGKQTLVLPDLKELNPAVPNALCEVVMQAVELRPEDRFATANDLSIALKQSVTGTFIGDRRRKDRETIRRNRVRNIGVAVCMGLLASACVYFLAPSQEEIFESALQDENKIREILNREASKQALVDQFPQLMDQFLSADDKETRLAFGNFAESLMNSAASSSGEMKAKKKKNGL